LLGLIAHLTELPALIPSIRSNLREFGVLVLSYGFRILMDIPQPRIIRSWW